MHIARLTPTAPLALLTRSACAAAACLCAACAGAVTNAPAETAGVTGGAGASASTSAPPGSSGAANPPAVKVRKSGIASWYGPGFYGSETACGQTLTPAVVGVANRTLPCGTLVRISYRGHAITVPVLDRGPYAHGVDWDLTAGAALALGITENVRIGARVVGSTANVPTLGSPPAAPAEAATGGAQAQL